jgi:hypothetical protein
MHFVDPDSVDSRELASGHYEPVGATGLQREPGRFDLLWMSPRDFLNVVDPYFEPSEGAVYMDPFREAVADPDLLFAPLQLFDNWNDESFYYVRGHEGRHRAWLAHRAGIPIVPVTSFKGKYAVDSVRWARAEPQKAINDEMWANYEATGWPFPPGEEPTYDLSVDNNIRDWLVFLGVGCTVFGLDRYNPLYDNDFLRKLFHELAARGDADAEEELRFGWQYRSWNTVHRILERYDIVLLRSEPWKIAGYTRCNYYGYERTYWDRKFDPFQIDGYTVVEYPNTVQWMKDYAYRNAAIQCPGPGNGVFENPRMWW